MLLCNTNNRGIEELPFGINHRRIVSFSLKKGEKAEIRKRIINRIMNNIQILKEQRMLFGNAMEMQEARETLTKLLWYGLSHVLTPSS